MDYKKLVEELTPRSEYVTKKKSKTPEKEGYSGKDKVKPDQSGFDMAPVSFEGQAPEVKHDVQKATVQATVAPETKRTETLEQTKKQDQQVMNQARAVQSKGSNLDWLIAGGIPMAVGMLGGRDGVIAGAEAGSQNISDLLKAQREEILANRKADSNVEVARLNAMGKSEKPSRYQVVKLKGGKYGRMDKLENKVELPDGTVVQNPEFDYLSDEKWLQRKNINEEKQIAREGRSFRDKAENNYLKSQSAFNTDIRDLQTARDLIGRGDLQSRAAVMSIVKKIEGRMTDEDRNFYLQPNAGWKQLKEYANRYADGRMNERVLAQATDLLDQTIQAIQEAKKSSTIRTRALLKSKSLDSKYIEDAFNEYNKPSMDKMVTPSGYTFEVVE